MDDREEMEDLEEDDVDYPIDLDVDLFDFHKKELKQIVSVLAISDTARDKFSFTVFSWNVAFTGFLAGYLPNYFYIWHTLKFVLLIIHRWYTYKKMQYHYFLFDFCYFTNLLILTYLWLPAFLPTALRGHLFIFIFAYAHGPLLSAIVLWRNSLVPHSVDKMTSLHIHISPAVALWGIRCKILNTLGIAVVLVIACYNGACFYIDVFSERYKIEKMTNHNKKLL